MDSVVHALRDAVGEAGTLMALSGWEDSPYHVASWPESWRQAYRDQPPFDPHLLRQRDRSDLKQRTARVAAAAATISAGGGGSNAAVALKLSGLRGPFDPARMA